MAPNINSETRSAAAQATETAEPTPDFLLQQLDLQIAWSRAQRERAAGGRRVWLAAALVALVAGAAVALGILLVKLGDTPRPARAEARAAL